MASIAHHSISDMKTPSGGDDGIVRSLGSVLPGGITSLDAPDFCPGRYLHQLHKTLSDERIISKLDQTKTILRDAIKRRMLSSDSLIFNAHDRYSKLCTDELVIIGATTQSLHEIKMTSPHFTATRNLVDHLLSEKIRLEKERENKWRLRAADEVTSAIQEILDHIHTIETASSQGNPSILFGPHMIRQVMQLILRVVSPGDQIRVHRTPSLLKTLTKLASVLAQDCGKYIALIASREEEQETPALRYMGRALFGTLQSLRDLLNAKTSIDSPSLDLSEVLLSSTRFHHIANLIQSKETQQISSSAASSSMAVAESIEALKYCCILELYNESMRSKIVIILQKLQSRGDLHTNMVNKIILDATESIFSLLIDSSDAKFRRLTSTRHPGPFWQSYIQTVDFFNVQYRLLDHSLCPSGKSLFDEYSRLFFIFFHSSYLLNIIPSGKRFEDLIRRIRGLWDMTVVTNIRSRAIAQLLRDQSQSVLSDILKHNFTQGIPFLKSTPDVHTMPDELDNGVGELWLMSMSKFEASLVDSLQLDGFQVTRLPFYRVWDAPKDDNVRRMLQDLSMARHPLHPLMDHSFSVSNGNLIPYGHLDLSRHYQSADQTRSLDIFLPSTRGLLAALQSALGPLYRSSGLPKDSTMTDIWLFSDNLRVLLRDTVECLSAYFHFITTDLIPKLSNMYDPKTAEPGAPDTILCFVLLVENDIRTIESEILDVEDGLFWEDFRHHTLLPCMMSLSFNLTDRDTSQMTFIDILRTPMCKIRRSMMIHIESIKTKCHQLVKTIENTLALDAAMSSVRASTSVLLFAGDADGSHNRHPSAYVSTIKVYIESILNRLSNERQPGGSNDGLLLPTMIEFSSAAVSRILETVLPKISDRTGSAYQGATTLYAQINLDIDALESWINDLKMLQAGSYRTRIVEQRWDRVMNLLTAQRQRFKV